MPEFEIIEVKAALDFTPIVEASHRMTEQFKLTAARLAGERAIVATDQHGLTRVHLRGPVAPGIVRVHNDLRAEIARREDRAFLLGPDA